MEQIHKQALAFENKLKSYVDDWNHHVAQSLKRDVQRLLDEIEVKKNPRSIEDRVKGIKQLVESLEGDSVMDFRHQDELIGYSDDLIRALRQVS